MYFRLDKIARSDIEGHPKLVQIDSVDVGHIQSYSMDYAHEHTWESPSAHIFVCVLKIILGIILEIGLGFKVIPVWVVSVLILNLLFIVQMNQWIKTLYFNWAFLAQMHNSIVLPSPIKKIFYWACIYTLYICLHHGFMMVYSLTDIFDIPSNPQYKIFIHIGVELLHCIVSVCVCNSSAKSYNEFETVVFEQIPYVSPV